jgi:hypothetical protein
MRDKLLRTLLLGTLLILLASCVYDSDEKFESALKSVQEPTLETVFLNQPGDTIDMRINPVLTFNFKAESHPILAVELLIDNVSQGGVPTFVGRFDLSTLYITRGRHQLKLNIYIKSESGCIADQLDVEYYLKSRKWILIY